MRVHYKNLNSIRCIAAFLVVISHVEQIKKDNDLPNHWNTESLVFLLSKIGVDLFFVLSGFLITSLLFIEKEKYKSISIRNFYLKRVLRIWPLYFFIIFMALFVYTQMPLLHYNSAHGFWNDGREHLIPNILLFVFFLPNLQALLYGSVRYAGQVWSIGVEEQYYLFWPWVMKKTKTVKRLKLIIISLIAFFILLKISLIKISYIVHNDNLILFLHFLKRQFPIHTILIGCYFAVLNHEKKTREFLTKKTVQVVSYLVLIALVVSQSQFKGFYWEVYAFVFGVIIMNLVNKTSIINLEFKPIAYLGKISYGIYMYHMVLIAIVVRGITTNNVLIYILSFGLTIIVASISYELVEKKILNFKDKLSKVHTG